MMYNPLTDLAEALYSACLRDLSPMDEGKISSRRPDVYNLNGVTMFHQMWGSTALGFGGIGGASMTEATVVIIFGRANEAAVYFGGRFAYLIKKPNAVFREDIAAQQMADVGRAQRKYTSPPKE